MTIKKLISESHDGEMTYHEIWAYITALRWAEQVANGFWTVPSHKTAMRIRAQILKLSKQQGERYNQEKP